MNKIIIKFCVFVWVVLPQDSDAQGRERLISDPYERAAKQTQMIDSICTLSGPQRQRIEMIQNQYAELTVELFNKKDELPRDSIRIYMMQLNQKKLEDMNLVLTAQQMKLWQDHIAIQTEKRGKFKNH